jgi:hypothetical protein
MSREYTCNPSKRTEALLLAAQIAFDGQESTVYCGESHFGGDPYMDFIEAWRAGHFVARHAFLTTLTPEGWVFGGMVEEQL